MYHNLVVFKIWLKIELLTNHTNADVSQNGYFSLAECPINPTGWLRKIFVVDALAQVHSLSNNSWLKEQMYLYNNSRCHINCYILSTTNKKINKTNQRYGTEASANSERTSG